MVSGQSLMRYCDHNGKLLAVFRKRRMAHQQNNELRGWCSECATWETLYFRICSFNVFHVAIDASFIFSRRAAQYLELLAKLYGFATNMLRWNVSPAALSSRNSLSCDYRWPSTTTISSRVGKPCVRCLPAIINNIELDAATHRERKGTRENEKDCRRVRVLFFLLRIKKKLRNFTKKSIILILID